MADIDSAVVLEKLKRKLSFSVVDEEKDALLLDLIGDTMDHFRLIAESLSGTYPEAIPLNLSSSSRKWRKNVSTASVRRV